MRRELDDRPGEGDVLHPGARDRGELAEEEEPVVAMVLQARERPGRGEAQEGHSAPSSSFSSGSMARSTASRSLLVSVPRRWVSQAVRFWRTERSTLVPSRVIVNPTRRRSVARGALDQARGLEPLQVAGHRRRRDPLDLRERRRGDAGAPLDRDEQAHLSARHAERVDLAPKLARQAQQDGAEAPGEFHRIVNRLNH